MKELFKQYNEEFVGKKILFSGDVFFTSYNIFEENKVFIDLIFVNKQNRVLTDLEKIIDVIESTFDKKGIDHISISLLFNLPYFAELLSILLNKGYKNSFSNEQGLILIKE